MPADLETKPSTKAQERRELERATLRPLMNRRPELYVQVNLGEEDQKGGCAIGDVGELVAAVRASPLPLAGLMAIPPLGAEPSPYFALLAELARRHDVIGLSMGMSADYETAVMIGATHVRVGTALFGERT